jgi:hypothetical protein
MPRVPKEPKLDLSRHAGANQIVKSEFKPRGSKSALQRAARILAPFPTSPIGLPTIELLHYETLNNCEDALALCETIARRYWRLIHEDNAAPRTSVFINKLKQAAAMCANLSSLVCSPSSAERDIVFGRRYLSNASNYESLSRLFYEIRFYGLAPGQHSAGVDPDPLPLQQGLATVSLYLNAVARAVEELYPDRGGMTNVLRITSAPPAWDLINSSWRPLHFHGRLEPTKKTKHPLQEFVEGIHEWITGEIDRDFESHIKIYLSCRKECDASFRIAREMGPKDSRYPAILHSAFEYFGVLDGGPQVARRSRTKRATKVAARLPKHR